MERGERLFYGGHQVRARARWDGETRKERKREEEGEENAPPGLVESSAVRKWPPLTPTSLKKPPSQSETVEGGGGLDLSSTLLSLGQRRMEERDRNAPETKQGSRRTRTERRRQECQPPTPSTLSPSQSETAEEEVSFSTSLILFPHPFSKALWLSTPIALPPPARPGARCCPHRTRGTPSLHSPRTRRPGTRRSRQSKTHPGL